MLCRYDTRALKSLDIFSVHGFPVGLIQCESNFLGIMEPGRYMCVGSGGWANIIEKFKTADTADKLRSITTEQIRAAFSDETMTTVRAENLQRQLLGLAKTKEIDELKQAIMNILEDKLTVEFPDAVIDAGTKTGYPYVIIWPKGKLQEVEDNE